MSEMTTRPQRFASGAPTGVSNDMYSTAVLLLLFGFGTEIHESPLDATASMLSRASYSWSLSETSAFWAFSQSCIACPLGKAVEMVVFTGVVAGGLGRAG